MLKALRIMRTILLILDYLNVGMMTGLRKMKRVEMKKYQVKVY